jgi:hypothetical protein
MMAIALIVMGLVLAALGVVFFVAARAPQGYQDESGFHFGPDVHERPVKDFHEAASELSR